MARLSRGETQHGEGSARGRIVNNSIFRAEGLKRAANQIQWISNPSAVSEL